jgi:DNA-binding NtrC family response regulator
MEKGERITAEVVNRQLGSVLRSISTNPNLPVLLDHSPEQAERELILRQLLLLRQDVGSIKQVLGAGTSMESIGEDVQYLPRSKSGAPISLEINENSHLMIKGEAIGDITLEELNREAIERTLKFYNNNRRAAARSLGMSERTLYRKISEYGLERKIKLPDEK